MRNFFNGFLMGAAETLPAINGSVVALLLGIYQKRIDQISAVITSIRIFLSSLSRKELPKWAELTSGLDLVFIISTGIGLFVGLIAVAFLVMGILENTPHFALSFITGLLIAVLPIPIHLIGRKYSYYAITALLAVVSWYLLGLQGEELSDPGLVYLAIAGFIAISGMTVPGLSGSFIMLILGVYYYVIGDIKLILTFQASLSQYISIGAFSIGAVLGLIISSRMIKYLLKNHLAIFMSAILGLILGSFRAVYPFVTNTSIDGLILSPQPISSFTTRDLVFMGILFFIPALTLGIINYKKVKSGEFDI